jgi:hypothetical protein
VREEREREREREEYIYIYIYIKHGIFVLGQSSINFKSCLIKLSFASARRLCLVLADLLGWHLAAKITQNFYFFIFLLSQVVLGQHNRSLLSANLLV